jgi:hypothetical protein
MSIGTVKLADLDPMTRTRWLFRWRGQHRRAGLLLGFNLLESLLTATFREPLDYDPISSHTPKTLESKDAPLSGVAAHPSYYRS